MHPADGEAMKGKDINPKVKAKFLQLLTEGATVQAACDQSGLARTTAYAHKRSDEAFAKNWEEAIDLSTDLLEGEAVRRAREGVTEPMVSNGKVVAHVQKYSDNLLMFLLKARLPKVYRENMAMELSGKDGGPIEVTDARAKLAARLIAQAARQPKS